MSRKKKLIINTLTSLIYQFVTIVVGFVLPRFYISNYGSSINGLMNSITHFLGFITLLNSGVGMVVQSALYKPLADKDKDYISRIILSSERFYKKIAYILVAYTAILIAVYPFKVLGKFPFPYTALLIGIISISSFAQYYFGITYRFLLNADQKSYVHLIIDCISTIINAILVIVFIKLGFQVHFVRLVTTIVFVGQVLSLRLYVKTHYQIDRKITLAEEPIKQKWNGFAQHIASVILTNTDTVVLTLFSTLDNVSVYGVYHMVVNGVKVLINSLTAGIQALFGNMLARNETQKLDETFSVVEWMMHTLVSLGFTLTGVLIIPFVKIYTSGVTDADYIAPVFAVVITVAQGVYCIRLPYNMVVLAAGHYKETQLSSFIEAGLNIIISILGVVKFGLVGVAIGTFVAMAYRTIYLAWYLRKNIMTRKFILFIKHIIVDLISAFYIVLISNLFSISNYTYLSWSILALKLLLVGLILVLLINWLFYRKKKKKAYVYFFKRKFQ